ncbi:fungal-specific transcription factor domain-containing protein [Flagelloscypha sp. PMI_526]|nr:fungal-specific transcription factor domain-containing protein [Flagelloscypha sp. PMI_526]
MEASGSKKDKISPNEDSSMLKPARARVWRACEVCRKRKVKCDGNDPCSYCISCGKECSFKESNDNASSSRQHAVSLDNRITKVEDTLRKLLPMAHAFEAWSRSNPSSLGGPFIVPDMNFEPGVPPPPRKETQTHAKRIPYKPSKSLQQMIRKMSSSSGVVSTPATPLELEPQEKFSDRFSQLTKDSHGNLRYVGGAGSYMLIEALASLQEGSGTGDDHAYKAVPFVTHHEQFRSLKSLPKPEDVTYPSSELADQLVQVYFESIHHTFPILQQQLFLDRYVSTMQKVHLGTPSKDPVYLACLFAVFACGSLFLPKTIRHSVTEFEGLEYYERAQIMLLHNSSSSYIEHVQCLALLSLCSASWNMQALAQSWLYAGQAVRRAQDLGLHRSTRFTMTRLEKELRCRVWWCVYGLDRVLSISLGRPLATHDDDCTVEYPAEIDDSDLLSWSEDGDNLSGDSYMTGFFALLKIYKVAGRIARVVQSSRLDDPDSQEAQTILSSLDQDLAQWIDELPDKIRFAEKGTSNPRLLSLSISAFFVYYASIIILHRPFAPDPPNTQTHLRSLAACLTAARSCIRIGALAKAVLPTSHHLAFAVQFITLSAILLVRSVHYVNQVELVEAILTDCQ